MPERSPARRSLLSYSMTILVLLALGYYIYRNFSKISCYDFEFQWILIVAAFFAAAGGYLVMFSVWRRLAYSFGLKAPSILAAKAFYLSQLGKYVPGKVGLVLVRMDAYRGYSRKNVALATGVEYIASFISACILILIAAIFVDLHLTPYLRWLTLGFLIVLLAALWPSVLKSAANVLFKLIKRQPIEQVPSFRQMLLFVSMYLIVGLFYGLSLFLVLNSLSPVSFGYYLAVTGTFRIASLIGIAAIFAPSGIGIREGVLMLVLPAFIPEPTVIIGAILIRFVLISAELALAGFFTILERNSKRTHRV